jgi:ubiquinone/menaquinone biosynthesis C-methylase UbiE
VSAYGLEQALDIKKMRRHLPARAKILDIGCGFGMPTAQASRHFEMSACDIATHDQKGFIETIMRMRGIEFKWIEGGQLPFPDASFDGVLMYAVIEHVADKEPFLRECARVLKPGGKIFAFRAVNKRAFAEWLARKTGLPAHGNDVVTKPMLQAVFEKTGFRIDRLGFQGWLPENRLPKWPVFCVNQILSRLPFINAFSHDYWLIAEKITTL